MAEIGKRSDDAFLFFGTPLLRGAMVLDGIFLAAVIVQCVYAVIALTRSQGHRGPFVAVLVAVLANACSHILGIVRFSIGNEVCESDEWNNNICVFDPQMEWMGFTPRAGQFMLLTAWWNFMIQWSDSLLLLASLLVLYQRSAVARSTYPHKLSDYPRSWRLVGCVAMGSMLLPAFIRAIVLGVRGVKFFDGSLDILVDFMLVPTVLNYIYSVIYLVMVAILVFSALSVRRNMKVVSVNDKPSKLLLKYATPLFVAHCTFWTFSVVFGITELPQGSAATDARIAFVMALDNDIFPCALISIFLWLGYHSRV